MARERARRAPPRRGSTLQAFVGTVMALDDPDILEMFINATEVIATVLEMDARPFYNGSLVSNVSGSPEIHARAHGRDANGRLTHIDIEEHSPTALETGLDGTVFALANGGRAAGRLTRTEEHPATALETSLDGTVSAEPSANCRSSSPTARMCWAHVVLPSLTQSPLPFS
eukprot:NODE_3383_length_794_cov_1.939107.p2 GENE.NODE_3383_length_794_cov_1.939107~~NODE_3383_length_794_cov_1.939107.p2  ORF type:complete len:185 (+),score=49.94 NODE_3383_length_794_cov_1.939107:45-557(+)